MIEDLSLKIKTFFEDSAFRKLSKRVKQAQIETQKLNEQSSRISQTLGAPMKEVQQEVKKATGELKRFRFEWLSVLFFGMAIQRAFGGILRASFRTWSAVTEGTSQAGGAMGQLTAAWEFFKYSLFDALLNSGLFQGFVSMVLKLVEWWSDLSVKTKSWIANLLIIGAIIGTFMFVFATIALGIDGISLLLFGQRATWQGIFSIVKSISGWITSTLIPSIVKLGTTMKAALSLGAVVSWITGILTIIGVLFLLENKFGSFGNALKAWGSAIALFFVGIFQFILNGVETVIDTVLMLLANVLDRIAAIAYAISDFTGDPVTRAFARAASRDAKLLSDLASKQFVPNLLQKTSVFLDERGWNPEPVGNSLSSEPQHIIVDNADDIGRATAERIEIPKALQNVTDNTFKTELERQGLGHLLTQ